MILTRDDIAQFEQRYRTAFVNSLAGFRQAVLVGTKSRDNNSNLAIFNSLIHLGANPALLGLINRPDSVQRDTLQNIIETKEYTLNYSIVGSWNYSLMPMIGLWFPMFME